jgi:outer membrane protein OmpA-like peptidoglycan-associated protein
MLAIRKIANGSPASERAARANPKVLDPFAATSELESCGRTCPDCGTILGLADESRRSNEPGSVPGTRLHARRHDEFPEERRMSIGFRRCFMIVTWVTVSLTAGAADRTNEPGVTDFSSTNLEAIESRDIATALAVPRGAHIEPAAPPTVRLPIFFEFNSATLLPESRSLLDKVGAALSSDELVSFRFSIEGHTDNVGSASYNHSLSTQRADSVKEYLVTRGVPTDRLGTIGHGENEPLADNSSDDGRQRNRRVELINLGNVE